MKGRRVVQVLIIGSILAMIWTLGGAGPAVAQQQQDRELAARTHFSAGEYQQALDIYARLNARSPHPTYIRNIGRCYQAMGEPDKAISAFREYLRVAKNLDADQRALIDGYIREMEDLKQQRQAAQAAPVPVTPPPPARVAAPPPAVADPSASAGEPNRVEASLKTSPATAPDDGNSPFYTRWWFWTAIGVAAAAGVTTAVVLSSGADTPKEMTNLGTMTWPSR